MLRRPAVWALSIALAPFTGPVNPDPVHAPVLSPYAWTASGSSPVAPACAPVPAGMIGWWRGENDVSDMAEVNAGTLQGSAGYAPGMVGQAFRLNGGYVLVPDHPSLDLTGEFTLEFWFNYNSGTAYMFRGMLGKRDGTSGMNYAVTMHASFLGLGMLYNDPTVLAGDDRRGGLPTPFESMRYLPVPAAGAFHHFAGSYIQASPDTIALRMYLDGQLVKSARLPGNLTRTVNNGPLTLGISMQGGNDAFAGLLDEVAVYGRALTGEEVAAIHAAGSAGKCRNMPFASLAIDRTQIVRDRGASPDRIDLRGRFALGAASDGIAPLTEEVEITLGSHHWTVPAGSFVRNDENDGFQFLGTFSPLKQVVIRDDGGFRVMASELNLPVVDAANPLSFFLRIGNDEGSMSIAYAERGRAR